jgi:hypothetical protein
MTRYQGLEHRSRASQRQPDTSGHFYVSPSPYTRAADSGIRGILHVGLHLGQGVPEERERERGQAGCDERDLAPLESDGRQYKERDRAA